MTVINKGYQIPVMHSFQVFDDVIFFVEQPVVEQNLIFVKKSIGKNDGEMLFKKTALFKFRYFGKLEIYFFYFGFYNLAFADAFCVLFKNTVPEQCLTGMVIFCSVASCIFTFLASSSTLEKELFCQ